MPPPPNPKCPATARPNEKLVLLSQSSWCCSVPLGPLPAPRMTLRQHLVRFLVLSGPPWCSSVCVRSSCPSPLEAASPGSRAYSHSLLSLSLSHVCHSHVSARSCSCLSCYMHATFTSQSILNHVTVMPFISQPCLSCLSHVCHVSSMSSHVSAMSHVKIMSVMSQPCQVMSQSCLSHITVMSESCLSHLSCAS